MFLRMRDFFVVGVKFGGVSLLEFNVWIVVFKIIGLVFVLIKLKCKYLIRIWF